jgi:hypothetical protein
LKREFYSNQQVFSRNLIEGMETYHVVEGAASATFKVGDSRRTKGGMVREGVIYSRGTCNMRPEYSAG